MLLQKPDRLIKPKLAVPAILIGRRSGRLTLIVVILLLSGLYLHSCQSEKNKQNALNHIKTVRPGTAVDFNKLIGRWLRPDGGYILEISRVESNGKLEAVYMNPRLINVSQALATEKDAVIHIFVELRDVGYPGATYTMTYDAANDVINGIYYQPALDQSFEIQFVRTN
jgi:hypothetical protein